MAQLPLCVESTMRFGFWCHSAGDGGSASGGAYTAHEHWETISSATAIHERAQYATRSLRKTWKVKSMRIGRGRPASKCLALGWVSAWVCCRKVNRLLGRLQSENMITHISRHPKPTSKPIICSWQHRILPKNVVEGPCAGQEHAGPEASYALEAS